MASAVEFVNKLVVTGLQIIDRPLKAGTVVVFTCTTAVAQASSPKLAGIVGVVMLLWLGAIT